MQLDKKSGTFQSVSCVPINNYAEYIHSKETELPNFTFRGSSKNYFYGLDLKNGRNELLENLKTYEERMPENFLPIAEDGTGNQICISLNENTNGLIYLVEPRK